MKDCEETELAVGDEVAIVRGSRYCWIERGVISKINIKELTRSDGTIYGREETVGIQYSRPGVRASTCRHSTKILKIK